MKRIIIVMLALAGATPSFAMGVCAYRPSMLVGEAWTAAGSVLAGAASTVGAGLKVAGYYSIQNAVTGTWMVGSTAAGTSAAGTVGIIPGTAGALGTAAAVLLSTPVLVGGAVLAGGAALYEGGCEIAERTGH